MPAMMLRKKMNHMIAYWPARTYSFRQLTNEGIGTRQVAARPGQTGDKTELDRVFGDVEDDGDSGGYGLGRQRGRGIGGDDHDDCRRTNSSANAGSRSNRPSAHRYSI